VRPRDAGDERISTRLKCPRPPVPHAFIVFLDVQLFVGGLASSSPSILLPGGPRAKRRLRSSTRIHIWSTYHSRSKLLYARPSSFLIQSPPLGISTFGDPLSPHFQLSAYKDDARRTSGPLFPCRAVALCHPPASSEVAEHSFPFRYCLVARL